MNIILCIIALAAAVSPAEPLKMVRVAIVDNSGSMQGDRIATVRSELTKVIHQLPPSPEFPLLLIVFDETVGPTQLLTDTKAAEKIISNLQGNGPGTRIAPALNRATQEIQKYQKSASVLVMLYTDGEDPDQQGIHLAEAQLDSLFSDRSRHGLSQTVFVKRWGNANAELITRLRASGTVRLLEAGELSIEPVTLNPEVKVIESHRDPNNPERLQLAYQPTVTMQGRLPSGTHPSIVFECANNGAAGQTRSEIIPNSKPSQFTLSVPIPAPADQAKEIPLSFDVSQSPSVKGEGTFVLPIFVSSKIVVPVTVPALVARNRPEPPVTKIQQPALEVPKPVTTTVTPVVQRIGKPVWVDLNEPLAVFDADVLFQVDGPIPYHTALTLVAPGNVRGNLLPPDTLLHSGESIVTLHVVARLTPGKYERLDFSVVAPPATPAIEFQIGGGFSLPVVAPPPAAIVAMKQKTPVKVLAISAADNQETIGLAFTPSLTGVDRNQLRRLPRVVAHLDTAASIITDNEAPLFRHWAPRLQLAPLASQPFFSDSQQLAQLELHPEIVSPAIIPVRLQVVLTRQAPFKRLLVYLAWAAFPLGLLVLAAHIVRRLRERVPV